MAQNHNQQSGKGSGSLPKILIVLAVVAAAVLLVLWMTGVFGRTPSPASSSEFELSVLPSGSAEPVSEQNGQEISTAPSASEPLPESSAEQSVPERKELTFRNSKLLDEHYKKHGIEMGFASAQAYEKAACDVVNNPDALHKIEKEDGDDVYYVVATNEFVVVSTDGFIRTYFLPNGGKSYFDRQ